MTRFVTGVSINLGWDWEVGVEIAVILQLALVLGQHAVRLPGDGVRHFGRIHLYDSVAELGIAPVEADPVVGGGSVTTRSDGRASSPNGGFCVFVHGHGHVFARFGGFGGFTHTSILPPVDQIANL